VGEVRDVLRGSSLHFSFFGRGRRGVFFRCRDGKGE